MNDAELKKINKKMHWVVNHLIAPAFKYWVEEHGLSMTSVDNFVKQLFTKDSNVQILNSSYISMGAAPLKTIAFDLGYYHDEKLVTVTSIQLLMGIMKK